MTDSTRVLQPYGGFTAALWLARLNLRKWKNLRFRQNAMTRSMITCRNSIEVSALRTFVFSSLRCLFCHLHKFRLSVNQQLARGNGGIFLAHKWSASIQLKLFRGACKLSSPQSITAFESTNPLRNIRSSAWLLSTHKDRTNLRRSTCWFNQLRKTFVRPAFLFAFN